MEKFKVQSCNEYKLVFIFVIVIYCSLKWTVRAAIRSNVVESVLTYFLQFDCLEENSLVCMSISIQHCKWKCYSEGVEVKRFSPQKDSTAN